MEKEYKVSWLKVMGVIVAFVVVIAVVCLLLPKNSDNTTLLTTYSKNIMMMKEAGFEYFQGSNLPDKVGSSNSISLSEMIDSKLIVEFLDENGKSCNMNESYIKVTKTLDKEYAMKVQLNCDNKSDYIVTSIASQLAYINSNSSSSNINTSDVSGGNTNNNNVTNNDTTNNNSGSNNGEGNISYVTPNVTQQQITNININYVNSCNNCSSSNCGNNCLSNIYYTVSYDTQGGSCVARKLVREGDYAPDAVTYKTGYTFLGWYLNGEKYNFNTPVRNTITLVAKWEKIQDDKPSPDVPNNKYTVTFDSNGGSYVGSQVVDEGNTAYRPTDPSRKCYEFLGWYLNGVKYDFNQPVTGNITLVARWVDDGTCKSDYNVKYEPNGGSYVESERVTEGNYATRPTNPTKACYQFAGWYTDSALTREYNFNTPVRGDMILYAKWVDDGSCVKNHTITFDSNGGSYIRSQTVSDGNRAYEPSIPTRSGYKFVGWYYNNSQFNFNTSIYRDYTLVARWEKEEDKYNTYCKVQTKTYYSTSYMSSGSSNAWQIRFDNLFNIQDLKITSIGYITTSAMYNNVYYNYLSGKGISSGSTSSKYEVPITSGSMLERYSLKYSNFTKTLSTPYYSNGYWYTNASIYVRNYNNVVPYNAAGIGNIYFVPFYFDVSYTDMNSCIDDYATNASRYSGYKVVASYYR